MLCSSGRIRADPALVQLDRKRLQHLWPKRLPRGSRWWSVQFHIVSPTDWMSYAVFCPPRLRVAMGEPKTKESHAMDELADLPASGVPTNGKMWTARTRVLRRAYLTQEQASKGDQLLLVYSLSVDAGPERYITGFPVSAEWLAELEDPVEKPHLKYNASLGA